MRRLLSSLIADKLQTRAGLVFAPGLAQWIRELDGLSFVAVQTKPADLAQGDRRSFGTMGTCVETLVLSNDHTWHLPGLTDWESPSFTPPGASGQPVSPNLHDCDSTSSRTSSIITLASGQSVASASASTKTEPDCRRSRTCLYLNLHNVQPYHIVTCINRKRQVTGATLTEKGQVIDWLLTQYKRLHTMSLSNARRMIQEQLPTTVREKYSGYLQDTRNHHRGYLLEECLKIAERERNALRYCCRDNGGVNPRAVKLKPGQHSVGQMWYRGLLREREEKTEEYPAKRTMQSVKPSLRRRPRSSPCAIS
jgi:hypothetical protein